jgi:hypothetical protein
VDSWVAAMRSPEIQVGDGEGEPVVVRGGRFVFATASEKLLTGLLPPLVYVAATIDHWRNTDSNLTNSARQPEVASARHQRGERCALTDRRRLP